MGLDRLPKPSRIGRARRAVPLQLLQAKVHWDALNSRIISAGFVSGRDLDCAHKQKEAERKFRPAS